MIRVLFALVLITGCAGSTYDEGSAFRHRGVQPAIRDTAGLIGSAGWGISGASSASLAVPAGAHEEWIVRFDDFRAPSHADLTRFVPRLREELRRFAKASGTRLTEQDSSAWRLDLAYTDDVHRGTVRVRPRGGLRVTGFEVVVDEH
ncbi:MAG TPA: hypothetical protein VF980_09405 [Thermoanaerobaculia bacterium]